MQKVVQTANDEQAQAIAAQDPSAMSDTATPAHYQQLVQVNQDLLNQGVTSIQLTNLTWGPINVNGTTATATTNETWTTTFSDGTTTQSTDTNNYALVQQDGKWLIQDDQQPSASTPAGQPSAVQQPSGQQPSGATLRPAARTSHLAPFAAPAAAAQPAVTYHLQPQHLPELVGLCRDARSVHQRQRYVDRPPAIGQRRARCRRDLGRHRRRQQP